MAGREDGGRSLSHLLAPSLEGIKCYDVHGRPLAVTWPAVNPIANGYTLIIVGQKLYFWVFILQEM